MPEPDLDEVPVPDLLGSILSGQRLLLMDSSDVTIHRDGSLSARQAGEAAPRGSPPHAPPLARPSAFAPFVFHHFLNGARADNLGDDSV